MPALLQSENYSVMPVIVIRKLFCHPVYNHDGSVNFFCEHDGAGAATKLLPLLFPLLDGFVFALALAVAVV